MDRATQSDVASPDVLSIATELYAKCSARQFGLECSELARILDEIARKFSAPQDATRLRDFCFSLKIEELVLARACGAGNERAWEAFMLRYREKLYEIGLHITREDSAARDLSDSIYAELYGTVAKDGHRVSKLASYTGRGSLE